MRYFITFILLGLFLFCKAPNEKKTEKVDVVGTIIFKFIPDKKFEGYYCSLKPEILINSNRFDFVPNRAANYYILKENPELLDSLTNLDSYQSKFETNLNFRKCQNCNNEKINCDSIIKEFRMYKIYDTAFYKPDYCENMTLNIFSNSIYNFKNSDSICIVFSFSGTVIKYENIVYGEQTDYRIQTTNTGTKVFDNSHGTCPFERYDSTFIVMDMIDKYDRVKPEIIDSLNLKMTALNKVKIFLYE
ncbi:hypothetical protein ACE01N_20500 [Saccharicrinis sp. FJH2]|uniref:hypothetical protein n=1 Tax=Saccharicrinis sp. FJH65 TaxID=3344659 RepID=UPI0035F4FD68